MRILEISHLRFVSRYAPTITDFYNPGRHAPPEERLTLPRILSLRKLLRAGHYDLVVYYVSTKALAPWHLPLSSARQGFESVYRSLFQFHRVAWHYFHFLFRGTDVPLVVIDGQDVPRITRSEFRWLDRCRFWFMRELPPNHFSLFLNMDRRCGDVLNIQRNPELQRVVSRIEPFSLGFDPGEFSAIEKAGPVEKIYDVFYSGSSHYTTLRQRGLEELRRLRESGVRVCIPAQRLSKEDFLRACAQSWIVYSPEGMGWDCHRHYEALMCRSVPLINTPTIERLHPFQDGVHCLYYRPETGGLTEAIERALQDREALLRIAEQGRAYILQHHTRSQLVRHILSSAGLLEQAGPHVLDI